MSDQVVTELVIDADTSGADQYSQAMDRAADAAVNSQSSISGVALAIAGVSASMIAAITGVNAFVDKIVSANKELADMQATAKLVGLSLADFQGIQLGGQIAGLSETQINAGLERSAQLLNDAQRNANSLSKEFDANGVSIRNANGQLISQNQLLGIAADLVRRAQSPGDAVAIAQMLGFTKEWIPLLEQGAGAMGDLTAQARAAGAVIDDETINKAAAFDQEWRKSSVEMSAYLKAALVGLLPYVDDLIQRLSQFIKSIDVAKAAAAVQEHADSVQQQLRDAGIPDSGGIKIGMTPETIKAIDDLKNSSVFSLDYWRAAGRALTSSVQVIGEQDVKWYAGTSPVMDTSDAAIGAAKNAAAWTAAGAAWKQYSADVLSGADAMVDGFSKVASRTKDVNDAFDRAVITVTRHTDQLYADADAVGLGAGALAKYRAEAQLMSAAEAAGVPITEALRAKIAGLAADAGDAANDLEKLKVASQIDFNRQTALLSPEDVHIAQQLKGIYGNDVPAALASSEAQAIRFNDRLKDVATTARSAAATFATDFVEGVISGKNALDALKSAADSVGKSLVNAGINNIIKDPTSPVGYVETGIGALMQLFGKQNDAALQQAKDEWAAMTQQIVNFNEAAKGFDLGPLTQSLQSLHATLQTLQTAALKAQDYASVAKMDDEFNDAVVRIVGEFNAGTQTLTPYAAALKALNDEASGLEDTLRSLGYNGLADSVAANLQKQTAELAQQYTDSLTASLQQRLNTANGKDYLNDLSNLVTQHAQDLLQAQQLGMSPDLANATFAAEAQKIVQDAGLVGDSFNALIATFPQLSGVVKQATSDITDSVKTISDYLQSLQLGSNSILSPQDQLAAAQSQFSKELGLAQGGDTGALGDITKYADTLLGQARSYYGSSAGYADIYQAVTAALAGLIGQPASSSGGVTSPVMSIVPSTAGNALTQALSQPSNDNSSDLFSQTQSLTQAIGSAANAQVLTLNNGFDAMGKKLDRIATALESPRSRAQRPNAKAS